MNNNWIFHPFFKLVLFLNLNWKCGVKKAKSRLNFRSSAISFTYVKKTRNSSHYKIHESFKFILVVFLSKILNRRNFNMMRGTKESHDLTLEKERRRGEARVR